MTESNTDDTFDSVNPDNLSGKPNDPLPNDSSPNPSLNTETYHQKHSSERLINDKYKLIHPIGEGGMGTVWLAEQRQPVKRSVALKLIKGGVDSKEVIARFEAERQALALMDHPNIARILDGGIAETGSPYFAMELVKGTPITEYCDRKKLSISDRLKLFIPVCQAIQHAHQKGIIHRDIKPSNILVAEVDDVAVPKVIDFGVAKATGGALTDKTLVTGFGLVGTPQYMSPEQATLNHLDIDTRSDIYSLGVLLYELLTGSPPVRIEELKAAGYMEILRVIREVEPPRPSTKVSTAQGLPEIAKQRDIVPSRLAGLLRTELDWVVMKALEKERARRYDTASALASDIESFLVGAPVQAHPPSRLYQFKKFFKRNRGPVLVVAPLAAVLLIATGVATLYAIGSARARATVLEQLADIPKLMESPREDDWSDAEMTIERANGQLRTFGFDPSNWKIINENERALEHLEKTERINRELLIPFYEAIASTTFDSATYAGNDPTVPPLRALLDKYCPGHDTPGVAEHFNSWLEAQGLSEFQERQVRETVGQACWNFALKLPWHPTMGFKNKEDEEKLFVYLKNGREIMGEEILGAAPTEAEGILQLRVYEARKDEAKVEEIWGWLEKTETKGPFDSYLVGKYYQAFGDMSGAAEIFLKGIEIAETRQRELLAEGREAEAELEARRIFGLSVGRALSFKAAGEYNLALAENMRAQLIAKSFSDKDLSSRCLGIAIGVDAVITWGHYGIDRSKTEQLPERVTAKIVEDINHLFEKAIELNPDHISNWNNAITFAYVSNQYERGLSLLEEVSEKHPERAFYDAMRAVLEAHMATKADAAVNGWRDILKKKGVFVEDRIESVIELEEYIATHPSVLTRVDPQELQLLTRAIAVEGVSHEERTTVRGSYERLTVFLLNYAFEKSAAENGFAKNTLAPDIYDFRIVPREILKRLIEKREAIPDGPAFFRFD